MPIKQDRNLRLLNLWSRKRDRMANRIQFNDFQKKSVYAKCNGKCAICGKPVKFKKMTIDHIMPLSRGGTNDIKNLQLACKRCNSMKSNMTMDDMMGQISEILKYNRKRKLIEKRNRTSRMRPKVVQYGYQLLGGMSV